MFQLNAGNKNSVVVRPGMQAPHAVVTDFIRVKITAAFTAFNTFSVI